MPWQQLLENLVDHLAWPAVIVVLVVVFRGQVGRFFERLVEVAFPGGHLRAVDPRELKKLTAQADSLPPSPDPDAVAKSAGEQLRSLEAIQAWADKDPVGAVLSAWDLTHVALAERASDLGLKGDTLDPIALAVAVSEKMTNGSTWVSLVRALWGLWDQIGHGAKVDAAGAGYYLEAVRRVLLGLADRALYPES